MNENGFIKIYRKMIDWEWYKNKNVKVVFLHCLLKANWKDGRFEGYEVPRGSFVTGRKQLSSELCMSEQSIRTSLSHLVSTNELTIRKCPKFSIITVVRYDDFQQINQQINQELTTNQPATNHNIRKKEYKKRESEERSNTFSPLTPPPTLSELRSYCYENNMEDFDYEYFYNYYEATEWIDKNGNQIKNWKNKLRNWYKRDEEKGRLKMPEDSRRLG